MEIKINKTTRELLSDDKFLDFIAKEMVIMWEEFELNWKHQMVDSPLL